MRTFIVDSFTDVPFKGNPAAVCLNPSEREPDQMLSIARELNLSETAFVQCRETTGTFNIRFFSPKMEIPLCGHATLAAARVAFDTYGPSRSLLRKSTELELVDPGIKPPH